jgi:putative oxidoreductase
MMTGYVASKGLPVPSVALGVAAAAEILGALTILVGFKARIRVVALFLPLIPTLLLFHNSWALQGMEKMNNQAHLFKNLAIMGGLLIVAANGAGGFVRRCAHEALDAPPKQAFPCVKKPSCVLRVGAFNPGSLLLRPQQGTLPAPSLWRLLR